MPPEVFRRLRYRWDGRSMQYRDTRTGRFVTRQQVRQFLDRAITSQERAIVKLGRQLRGREISLRTWELRMRESVKNLQLFSAAAAKGGWAQMSPADYGRVGQITRTQYRYLANFAKQIAKGLPLDGHFIRRVELYAQAGRGTYHAVLRSEMARAGFDEERSRLNPADHCQTCREEAAMGWQPIGTVVPIGQRDCLSRCRCDMEYRKSFTGETAKVA